MCKFQEHVFSHFNRRPVCTFPRYHTTAAIKSIRTDRQIDKRIRTDAYLRTVRFHVGTIKKRKLA